MNKIAVVGYKRTAIGKFGGVFKNVSGVELGITSIRAALEESEVKGDEVDEVVMGVCWQAGQKANPARQAAIGAGIRIEAPAVSINQQCSSGIRAVDIGADQIILGKAKVVVAGGFESMSSVPYIDCTGRWGHRRGPVMMDDSLYYDGLDDAFSGLNMGNTAETVGKQAHLSRKAVDIFAVESQEKAARAIGKSRFAIEIVPYTMKAKKAELIIEQDENPRSTTLDSLSELKPAFQAEGICTAGNSPPLSDGAAAIVLMDAEFAKEKGHKILGYYVGAVSVGVDPEMMGIGPVPAVRELLRKYSLSLEDIDYLEVNEAFGAQALACIKELAFPLEKVNVNGGAIALGHPPGMTGTRLIGTLVHELRLTKKKFGIATLCAGGGPAIAALIQSAD
ncbi:thiolase family protein [Brevibacillus choshinensis]|uniref:thiolase family protein n=1 Tax=Brevibacillus choshinensis TaxID=54911 RepID=UPI002E2148CA|nr:thiolase family protein [Brevibacillus choshinensis]